VKTWYLSICIQCNGGMENMVAHPEQFMPMPFDDKTRRSEWTDTHMEGTGHSVLLMNQQTSGGTAHDD